MIAYSVIVPVYNAATILDRCLQALVNQSVGRQHYEILVVDDGSNDQSAAIAEKILQKYPDIHGAVIRVPHRGQAAARNQAIQAASGEIILFTDSDCEPAFDWIERSVEAFADPHIAGIKGTYRTRQSSLVARFVQQEYLHKYDRMAGSRTIDFIDTYSAAYRRNILSDAGGFEAAMLIDEDQELSFRLASVGHRLIFEPAAVVYHQHVDTVMKYFKRKFKIGFWKIAVLIRHRAKVLNDSHTPQSLKAQVALLGLSLVAAAWGGIRHELLAVSGFMLVLFAISALPLLCVIGRRDPAVLWIAPLMILCRALALGMGLAAGAARFLIVPRKKNLGYPPNSTG